MQRQGILYGKLTFIRWFFDKTTAPFSEMMRKIDAREPPYEFDSTSDESSEPPYLLEGMDAYKAIRLQGQLCLNLLQRSLMEYLDDTVRLSQRATPSKKRGWFQSYREWFLEEGIDWTLSSANLSLIEELTLARNRIQHGTNRDSHSLIKDQDEDYRSRCPSARFQSDAEAQMFKEFGPKLRTIELTEEKLAETIEEIRKFSAFIENNLPSLMKHRRS